MNIELNCIIEKVALLLMSLKGAKKQKQETKPVPLNVRTCSTCHRDISDEIYVKCARCHGFNQCLECFSVGMETQSHLKTHPFILLEPFLQPIFQKGWSSEEEITLLNAIQSCGLGNWHEISDLIKTKTPLECEVHYFNSFIDSPIAPFPEEKILPEAILPPPPDFDTSPRESRPSISHEKNLAERNKKEKTTPAEFAGWMPRRCEFEVEYLNDAEQLIAGVTFSETADTAQSLDQKLTALRIYNEQLEERHIRTHFAIDYGMLQHEFRSFGGRTKSEREMEEAMMPLAQIASREELTNFIHSLENQMRIESQIETLKKWRKNGIVTRDEGVLFNHLQDLLNEEKLTQDKVEKWNRSVQDYSESPEFRATLDRQLLTTAENQLCRNLGLSPHTYLRIKDILIREFMIRGVMTPELAVSLMPPGQEHVMISIYESIKKLGLFLTSEDIENIPQDDENEEKNDPQIEKHSVHHPKMNSTDTEKENEAEIGSTIITTSGNDDNDSENDQDDESEIRNNKKSNKNKSDNKTKNKTSTDHSEKEMTNDDDVGEEDKHENKNNDNNEKEK